jgi:electron transport complex protein RnfG
VVQAEAHGDRGDPVVSGAPQIARITASLTLTCALGAAVLGGVYVGTERYARAAALAGEQRAIAQLLGLGAAAEVTEVRQSLDAARRIVIYASRPLGDEASAPRRVAFDLDGRAVPLDGASAAAESDRVPLGRLFVAREQGRLAGFVAEGEVRGYKNVVRFLVALAPSFEIAGVRVVEHEEDPGLGAEIATPWFQGQYVGRPADSLRALDVTRDPMPEDWRAALAALQRVPAGTWASTHGALLARERGRPIYAVTGATISSRALTLGVRTTVDHFRRRWALLEPHLGGAS